jgi:hypothetical protein
MSPTLNLVVTQEQFEQISRGELAEVYRMVYPYWEVRITRKKFTRILVVCGSARNRTLERSWQGYTVKKIGRRTFIEQTGMTPMSSASTLKVFAIRVD